MRSLATTPLGAGAAPTASVPAPPTTGVTWVASLRRVLRFEALTVWRTSNRWVVPLVALHDRGCSRLSVSVVW